MYAIHPRTHACLAAAPQNESRRTARIMLTVAPACCCLLLMSCMCLADEPDSGERFEVADTEMAIATTATPPDVGVASGLGIWMPGSGVSDGQTVTKASDNTQTYTVKFGKSRLIKRSKVQQTLNDISGVEFFFVSYATITVNSQAYAASTLFYGFWDSGSSTFKLTKGTPPGGSQTLFSPVHSMTAGDMNTARTLGSYVAGLSGYFAADGTSFMASTTTLTNGNPGTLANGVIYEREELVKPGDATVPTSLKCARNCPTAASLTAINNTDSAFTTGTDNSMYTASANVETYSWSASSYTLSDSLSNAINNDALPADASSSYKLTSGALVAASDLSSIQCTHDASLSCDNRASELASYYVLEVFKDDTQNARFLMSGSTPVTFADPVEATLVVPGNNEGSNAPYGSAAGATLKLKYSGFGQLRGIPFSCFDRATNAEEACAADSRYAPQFTIPDGHTVTVGGKTKYVKSLLKEARFATLSSTSSAQGITMGSENDLPAEPSLTAQVDSTDPSNQANSAYYVGVFSEQNMQIAPSVIDAVLQP